MLHISDHNTTAKDKRLLRRKMRARRLQLTQTEQSSAALDLLRQFSRTSIFRNAVRIACYYPNDGEIDPRPIIEYIWRSGKQCFLPIVVHRRLPLRFSRYQRRYPLRENPYGILEPVVHRRDLVTAHNLELILVPLVAFDRNGSRLGMGAGLYDRTLSFLRTRKLWRAPLIIGVAHAFQEVDCLPKAPWDVHLHGIVTEKSFITI